VGYIKGKARTSSAFALLHWCFENNVDLLTEHPKLHASFREVWAHPISVSSKLDEGLLNMKLPVRGSIRKANNIIQTVLMIQNINKYGAIDIGAFVRRWNSQTGKSTQIIGKKAISLKLIFEATPPGPLQLI
jgi:hypothetical protein